MNFKNLIVSVLVLAGLTAQMSNAKCHGCCFRPRFGFGVQMAAPEVYYAPYVATGPYVQTVCAPVAQVVHTPYVPYRPYFRPQVGFGFGTKHFGFGFSI